MLGAAGISATSFGGFRTRKSPILFDAGQLVAVDGEGTCTSTSLRSWNAVCGLDVQE